MDKSTKNQQNWQGEKMKKKNIMILLVLLLSVGFTYACTCEESDLNGDEFVNNVDLGLVQSCFNQEATGDCSQYDFDNDSMILINDISCIGANFGCMWPDCAETGDDGNDPYDQGCITYYINENNYTDCDFCVDGTNKLTEGYCVDGKKRYMMHDCGYGCENGACQTEDYCRDTESETDYFTKGTVTTPSNEYEDYCDTRDAYEGHLHEYYCGDTTNSESVTKEVVGCENGCENGACMSNECTDSDGGRDVDVYGEAISVDGTGLRDTCATSGNLNSSNKIVTSCDGTGCYLLEAECKDGEPTYAKLSCNQGCKRGICGDITKECEDSDGGVNYKDRGTTTGEKYGSPQTVWTDNCINSYKMVEFYCGDSYVENSFYDCEYGCEDGECINESGEASFEIIHLFPQQYEIFDCEDGDCGRFYADVDVVHNHHSNIENVYVTVSIPELRLVHQQFIDELQPDFRSSPTDQFNINLPADDGVNDVQSKIYTINFTIEYQYNGKDYYVEETYQRGIVRVEDITCQDSDAQDYFTKGEVKLSFPWGEDKEEDSCCDNCHTAPSETGKYVSEYICEGNLMDRKVFECPNGCEDGACLSTGRTIVSCSDSDGKDNLGEKGYIQLVYKDGSSEIKIDGCEYSGEDSYTKDWWCYVNEEGSQGYRSSEAVCHYGCEYAVCNEKPDCGEFTDMRGYPDFYFEDGEFDGYIIYSEFEDDSKEYAELLASKFDTDRVYASNTKYDWVRNPEDYKIISLGSPCINTVSAKLEGDPVQCNNKIEPNTGQISLMANNKKPQMIVQGWDSDMRERAFEIFVDMDKVVKKGTKWKIKYRSTHGVTIHHENTQKVLIGDCASNPPSNPSPGGSGNSCSNGCRSNGNCLSYGTRLVRSGLVRSGTPVYCDFDNEFTGQKQLEVSCQNNYECLTNSCINGECADLAGQIKETNNLVVQIFEWLRRIFS